MIAHSNLRLVDAFREIQSRLQHYKNSFNYDWGSVVSAINGAVSEVASVAMPYEPDHYRRQIEVSNGQNLGPNFIRRDVLYVYNSWDGALREARYASPEEIFSVTDYEKNVIWAQASPDNPAYTIFGNKIYICDKLRQDEDFITTGTGYGVFEGIFSPSEIYNDTDIVVCPPKYQEVLFLQAIVRLYTKGENLAYVNTVYREIELLTSAMFKRSKVAGEVANAQLESFVTEKMVQQGFNFNTVKRKRRG